MRIVCIDNNEVSGGVFCRAISKANESAHCEIVSDRLKTVNIILDSSCAPDYIFLNGQFRDIPCRALVVLIKKQAHLRNTRIVVMAEYVKPKDFQIYSDLGVRVQARTRDITASVSEILSR